MVDNTNHSTNEEGTMFNVFPIICTDHVATVSDFYRELFEFEVLFDSGWYVHLGAASDPTRQIGIVERTHPSVPVPFQRAPSGVVVSIELDDVDAIHERAVRSRYDIVFPLTSEDFGQRHFMIVDPAGTLVDVITQIEPTDEFKNYGLTSVAGEA